MNPIQLNKETIEALNSGASMILMPIELSNFSKEIGMTEKDIDKCIINKDGTVAIYFRTDDSQINELPLQIGQEYFIQEDYTEDEILLGGDEILYKNDFMPRDFKNEAIGYGLTTDHMKERVIIRCNWINASQMKENQSRIKFKVKDIQVKKVDNILDTEFVNLGYLEVNLKPMSTVKQFYKDYKIVPYSNEDIFLIEIEKLK